METTNLEVIRRHPDQFTFGTVNEIHDLVHYTFVLATQKGSGPMWYVYVHGVWTGRTAASIESAMILAVAIGDVGRKVTSEHASYMHIACCKLLEIPDW